MKSSILVLLTLLRLSQVAQVQEDPHFWLEEVDGKWWKIIE